MPVVIALSSGPHRFNRLQRSIPGISHRLLADTLRRLERDGMVTRGVSAGRPPSVDYRLTAFGAQFVGLMQFLATWALTFQEDILGAQTRYDAGQ